MKKIQYQVEAISALTKKIIDLLNSSLSSPIILFKAPTGSGKTYMSSELIRAMITDQNFDDEFSFIWIAPNKLEDQSYDSLKKYFKDTRDIKCSKRQSVAANREIKKNEILFINWQSINNEDNIFRRNSERDLNLGQIIKKTKALNRKIILIVDEIHHSAGTSNSKEIIEKIIEPNLTIGVSATPSSLKQGDVVEEIPLYKVREAGMIKEFATINPGPRNEYNGEVLKSGLGGATDKKVIQEAINKRNELRKAYKKLGKKINPLILIQIPDEKKTELVNKVQVEGLLKDFGINTQNKKLAMMLHNDKKNYSKQIKEDLNNEIEVLICKQAINIGWDCPRAQILVALRNWQNETFKTQTVGRIMRMPEQMHYSEKTLNRSYIFTNLNKISIKKDSFTDIRYNHAVLINKDAKKIK